MMKYKGYVGDARLDAEAGVFRGKVVNISDTVTFQAKTVKDLVREFHESVDDYLEFCASRGEAPDKPFSGRIPLRVTPSVHRALTTGAKLSNRSLNSYVGSQLAKLARKIDAKLAESKAVPKSSTSKTSAKAAAKSPKTVKG
jgi:predicted HicB family RNase H-like nuclease